MLDGNRSASPGGTSQKGTPVIESAPGPATLATIDRWLAYRVWHSRVPGAQVAIALGGEPVFSRGYGFADLEQQTPMGPGHLFRIASHSKTFTATVVMQLVEESRLGLEDRLADHLPELAEHEIGAAAIRELLEHTSGVLRDGVDGDFWQLYRPFPDRAELITMARAPVKGSPGERFAYSNIGYGLLGQVIESVTGESYAAAIRRRIVEPLDLTDTSADYRLDRAADYAVGYSGMITSRRRERIEHLDTSALDAATGFSSTATDLARYFGAHALGNEKLITDRSKRLMQRRANAVDRLKASSGSYGLGLAEESIGDHRLIGHGGGYPGHITKTLLDPGDGLVVSVLTNAIDGPASALAAGVIALIDAAREQEPESAEFASRVADVAGRWSSVWSAIDIGVVGSGLRTIPLAGWDPLDGIDRLEPVEPDGYRIEAASGYGSLGEQVRLGVDGVLRYGSFSFQRFDELPERSDELGG